MLVKNILHITPHLGGGVGTVLLDWMEFVQKDTAFNHSICCLDFANDNAKKKSLEIGFSIKDNMHKNIQELLSIINNADIVLIHFWNHPILYDFIIRNELPECRLIMWSHISGLNPPNVFTDKILNYPDKFIFTTPMSFETKEVINYNNKNSISTIWSTSNLNQYSNLEEVNDDFFNILYIGTVDNAKMYNNFLELCSKINIPNIKFIICGGPNHIGLKERAIEMGISHKFEFLGKISDIRPYLQISRIFGYPLTKGHFGTCDQSLQEAMTAGLVPVVFDNPMEVSMVHKDYGFICSNEEEYIKSIESLYKDKLLLSKLSKKNKEYALNTFSINSMIENWNNNFEHIMKIQKTKKKWCIDKNTLNTIDIFFESLGEYREIFSLKENKLKNILSQDNWSSSTKGTHKQYKDFLDDGSLDKFIF